MSKRNNNYSQYDDCDDEMSFTPIKKKKRNNYNNGKQFNEDPEYYIQKEKGATRWKNKKKDKQKYQNFEGEWN